MMIKSIESAYRNKKTEQVRGSLSFEKDEAGEEMNLVSLYPQIVFQTFQGFGGALTEAAGYTLSMLSEENYNKVIADYFGQDGIGYRFMRTHIDSCDFSLGNYAAIEENDIEFKTFSLERDEKYVQPLLRKAIEAVKAAEGIPAMMLTPWSPPPFMKTNGAKNGGGKLKKEYYKTWAEYICNYIKEYLALGFPVRMLSIQNEPKAAQIWDSCVFSAEEEKEFLTNYLKPSLIKNQLQDIKILVWDHNKERVFDRAEQIFDEITGPMADGIAFHWYSGDHFEALELVRKQYPDKMLVFTEGCVEYSRFGDADPVKNAEMYAHDIIGNLNAGMNLWMDWNIALDEKGGPNHVGNYCDAPVMCDTKSDRLEYKLSFVYISHFSKYIKPGAKRIGFSKYTHKLEMTAFQNPDGTIAVVFLNTGGEELPVVLRLNHEIARFPVKGHSIMTALLHSSIP